VKMTDLTIMPTAAAPPTAARTNPGPVRSSTGETFSFEKALRQAAKKQNEPERDAELAVASQAAARTQQPFTPLSETRPPEEGAPPSAEQENEKIEEVSENQTLLQAAALYSGKSVTSAGLAAETGSVEVAQSELPAIAPSQENILDNKKVAISQENLAQLDGIPTLTLADGEGDDKASSLAAMGNSFEKLLAEKNTAQPVEDPALMDKMNSAEVSELQKHAGMDSPAASKTAVEPPANKKAVSDPATEKVAASVTPDSAEKPAPGTVIPVPVDYSAGKNVAASTIPNEPARLAEARNGEIIKQVSHALESLTRGGQSTLRLQLNPQDMGRIDLRLTSSMDGLRVWIQADQAQTGRLLESSLNQLKQSLHEAGVQLSQLSVGQGNDQQPGTSWMEQGRNQARQRTDRPQKTVIDVEEVQVPLHDPSQSLVDYQV